MPNNFKPNEAAQVAASLIAMEIEGRDDDIRELLSGFSGHDPARIFTALIKLAAAAVMEHHEEIGLPDPAQSLRNMALTAAHGPLTPEDS